MSRDTRRNISHTAPTHLTNTIHQHNTPTPTHNATIYSPPHTNETNTHQQSTPVTPLGLEHAERRRKTNKKKQKQYHIKIKKIKTKSINHASWERIKNSREANRYRYQTQRQHEDHFTIEMILVYVLIMNLNIDLFELWVEQYIWIFLPHHEIEF